MNDLILHKGAVYETVGNKFIIKVKGNDISLSAGFYYTYKFNKSTVYYIQIDAVLIYGDKAFVYCEDEFNTRIIPRTHFITSNGYKHTFKLENIGGDLRCGILFWNKNVDYEMVVNKFIISVDKNKEDMQLRTLTKDYQDIQRKDTEPVAGPYIPDDRPPLQFYNVDENAYIKNEEEHNEEVDLVMSLNTVKNESVNLLHVQEVKINTNVKNQQIISPKEKIQQIREERLKRKEQNATDIINEQLEEEKERIKQEIKNKKLKHQDELLRQKQIEELIEQSKIEELDRLERTRTLEEEQKLLYQQELEKQLLEEKTKLEDERKVLLEEQRLEEIKLTYERNKREEKEKELYILKQRARKEEALKKIQEEKIKKFEIERIKVQKIEEERRKDEELKVLEHNTLHRIFVKRPLISVICVNNENKESIKSIYAQTYRPIEIITNSNLSIYNELNYEYMQNQINIIHITMSVLENSYVQILNECIKRTTGEIIVIYKDTLKSHPERFNICVDKIINNKVPIVSTFVIPCNDIANIDFSNTYNKKFMLSSLVITRRVYEMYGLYLDFEYGYDKEFIERYIYKQTGKKLTGRQDIIMTFPSMNLPETIIFLKQCLVAENNVENIKNKTIIKQTFLWRNSFDVYNYAKIK